VLGDPTLFNAEKVINASGYATKRSLGNDKDEVTFAKYLVHALVYDRLTFGGKSLQTRNQPRDCIGDPRVVLDVFIRIDVCERSRISGLERLQEINDLFFAAGRHGSSRAGSQCNNGPFGPLCASLRDELSDNVAMGRRKLFTREDVLNKTIPVFWKHGLAETSVQDLEQATGVRKSGLYAEFKDKQDLFVASMRQYFDMLMARGALTKQPLGWDNVEGFLKVCYGSWGQKGCFSVNSMREFADLPRQARQLMIANMTKAAQLLVDNLTAARGEAGDNESLADLIITFFCGISLQQNLSPDRVRVTKKIEHFMKLIRGM
jgi:AcrR family transcriptional regulator